MPKIYSTLKEIFNYREAIKSAIMPDDKLRFVNWYLHHKCNLSCSYCKVPNHDISIMNDWERREVLKKIRTLSVKGALMSIIGGEPTLTPALLINAVSDAAKEGFLVNIVTSGYGLTPELIRRLGEAGLHHLAISVDCDHISQKRNLAKAIELHSITKKYGILPVINTVITRNSNHILFKQFTQTIIKHGIFVSPLSCSPAVPNGAFSNASNAQIPIYAQLKKIIPWLIWKKMTTGMITASLGYLLKLLWSARSTKTGIPSWHCSTHFRSRIKKGRGFITLDSDGFIGPCQEFPRLMNSLQLRVSRLDFHSLEKDFSKTSLNCTGCLHNCYVMEENMNGLKSLTEIRTLFRMADLKGSHKNFADVHTI